MEPIPYAKVYNVINESASRDLLERYSDLILKGSCYTNIYDLITKKMDIFELVKSGQLRVCIGYADSGSGYLARHLFMVSHKNEVIDPTFALYSEMENTIYYSIKEYDLEKYLDAIEKEMYTALYNDTMKESIIFQQNMFLNGMSCIG